MPAARAIDGLTELEQAIVHHYIEGAADVRGNATRSAMAAGYSPRCARQIAHQVLARPQVRERLRQVERTTKLQAFASTAFGVLTFLGRPATEEA